MLSEEVRKSYINLINQEVKPALGCTEPIAVALAVARSKEEIGTFPTRVKIEVSGNILKNGMGVGIPGTGMIGLEIASALSLICGESSYGLEVLKSVDKEKAEEARQLVCKNLINISIADTKEKLYIKATCISDEHTACTIISGRHDNIIYVERDGVVLVDKQNESLEDETEDSLIDVKKVKLTVRSIYEFATTTPFSEIEFILEGGRVNRRLATEGLEQDYGLRVGKSIKKNASKFGNGLFSYSMALTAAASDARMSGCVLPAMSNSGSGNQGITVMLPVVAMSESLKSSEEDLARGLILSNLIAIHIKSYLGRLSALCGCVVASTGSACGMVHLMGGDYDNVCYSIKNMVGDIVGMICDGAKAGCAIKVSSGVSSAVQAAMLAMEDTCISENDGIIDRSIEKTIENIGRIGSKGMLITDEVILDIMVNKNKSVVECF